MSLAPSSISSKEKSALEKLHPLTMTNNIGTDATHHLMEVIALACADAKFAKKYINQSMFPIASGAFGQVFRFITRGFGERDIVEYPESLVRQLQSMTGIIERTKKALRDPYRNTNYLDLVAVKFENPTSCELADNSATHINLVREYLILRELFSKAEAKYSMAGFPVPIEFGFLGSRRLSNDLKSVKVVNLNGVSDNYENSFCEQLTGVLEFSRQNITDKSYMALELVGPSIQEWGDFYKQTSGFTGEISFTVNTTFKLMDQVLCRLIVMHRKGFLHLDLKPDNICMGVGRACNTIYLLDYGLSKRCSSEQPEFTVGSKRYMSLGVVDLKPANFMMDIESWFYVLTIFLCGWLPWTEEAVRNKLARDKQSCNEEKIDSLSKEFKREFWKETVAGECHLRCMLDAIMEKRSNEVEDIDEIYTQIYLHVRQMRNDYSGLRHEKMKNDIRHEDSPLFRSYMRLRKLLLHVYDIDLSGGIFAKDKELILMREARRHPRLQYITNGRDWLWDWDK